VHEHLVQQQAVDLQHVQADEMWVKLVGRRVWMAMAMAAPSRLWLGGVIGAARDGALIAALVKIVRSCALCLAILVCVDGLASYVTAFVKGFRHPVRTGKVGRPPLEEEKGLLLGQVIKRYQKRRVTSVTTRVVRGKGKAIRTVLKAPGTSTQIHTAYIERLNATFRSALCFLARRSRRLLHREGMLQAGMYLVGCAYNFCWYHASLRQAAPVGAGRKWVERTPAMAAGLTNHGWTMTELLHYPIPLSAWEAPKRRRRPRQREEVSAAGMGAKRPRGTVPPPETVELPLAA
jgi:hypothetical protein